jgi:DNA polymerase-3 subunit alpha
VYHDLFDFCQRLDLRKVNRRVIESLIRAGAMDCFEVNRATLINSLSTALQLAEQHLKNQNAGVDDMFGFAPAEDVSAGAKHYLEVKDWSEEQRLRGEKETLGLYLTGHPIEPYLDELQKITTARIVDLKPAHEQTVTVAGLVIAMRTMNTRRGDRMAFITLDDRSGRIELALFSDIYQRYRDLVVKDQLLIVEGEVSVDEYSGGYKMSARQIFDIQGAREAHARRLEIRVDAGRASNGFTDELATLLSPFREGECFVCIDYASTDARALVKLGEEWRVHPADELMHRLRELVGEDNVRMVYR